MKAIGKMILMMTAISLIFVGNVLALPTTGDQIIMYADYGSPYLMTGQTAGGDSYTYKTFCLESENYFTPDTPYTVESVGNYAVGGGSPEGQDEVSDTTKWLYAAYMSGVFNNLGSAAGKWVQTAIWYEEDEADGVQWTLNYLKTYYSFDDTGWFVQAVNLTDEAGQDIQSQLVGEFVGDNIPNPEPSAPVPEPATMLLLGTGLIGLGGVGRRKIKK